MGLAERRVLARLREETVPQYEKELREITGTEMVLDVDFKSFEEDVTAIQNLESKCLKPLCDIFRAITIDDMGKEAVRESIRRVSLSHGTIADIQTFTIVDGALKMPWDWKGWAGSFFPDSVREKIESLI